MEPRLGLAAEDRAAVVAILNLLLCDEYVLYTKSRNYHWNVVGPQLNDLRKFFENQYETLNDVVDEVAEHARALGGSAFGTLAEFSKHARLREYPGEHPDAPGMIGALLDDQERVIRQLRNDLVATLETHHDAGTSDFLMGLMEKHEKMAWMLRAFLDEGQNSTTSDVECRRIAALLADYLDGTLPKGQREVIDGHIDSCAPCLAFVNTYRCTVNAAQRLRG